MTAGPPESEAWLGQQTGVRDLRNRGVAQGCACREGWAMGNLKRVLCVALIWACSVLVQALDNDASR
jgi:hypothetical protein